MSINLRDFDVELFIRGKPLELLSEGLDILEKVSGDLAKHRSIACLIADPGTGVENFFNRYKEKNLESVFIMDCFKCSNMFADLMLEIGLGHKLVNWYDTPIPNIVEALIYYLNAMNNRTLLIFNHCDSLNLAKFAELLDDCALFKNRAGIIFRITKGYGQRILKSSKPELRQHLATVGRLEIDYPSEKELLSACHKNGIISAAVANGIVKDTFDFDVICSRVESLRADVKSFIQANGKRGASSK